MHARPCSYAVDLQVVADIVHAVFSWNGDGSQFYLHFLLSHLSQLLLPEFAEHHRGGFVESAAKDFAFPGGLPPALRPVVAGALVPAGRHPRYARR